jgi:hypothetical protein
MRAPMLLCLFFAACAAPQPPRPPMTAEQQRRHDYCHDFAAAWHTSTAPDADFFASLVVGTSPQYRSAYRNCMLAFGRTDIYLGN